MPAIASESSTSIRESPFGFQNVNFDTGRTSSTGSRVAEA